MKTIFIIFVTVTVYLYVPTVTACEYGLCKPTGEYAVGFKDFHWIDRNRCSATGYNVVAKKDCSIENVDCCAEIMVRIYYPTKVPVDASATYDQLIFKLKVQQYAEEHTILFPLYNYFLKEEIKDLEKIKSFTMENATIVADTKFPVLLFVPGYTSTVQFYENIITEVVSHGYIVVGINTPYIQPVAWPSDPVYIVKPKKYENKEYSRYGMQLKPINLQVRSMAFVLDRIKTEQIAANEQTFTSMDLNHVGALGHSLGTNSVIKFAKYYPQQLQAVATLDFSCFGNAPETFITIPFIHIVAAGRKSYELELYQGCKVVISPDKQDAIYSNHLDFTDLASLRKVPVFSKLVWYLGHILGVKFAFGTGDSLEITQAINKYLLSFFDAFLKEQKKLGKDFAFAIPETLTNNSYIQCAYDNKKFLNYVNVDDEEEFLSFSAIRQPLLSNVSLSDMSSMEFHAKDEEKLEL